MSGWLLVSPADALLVDRFFGEKVRARLAHSKKASEEALPPGGRQGLFHRRCCLGDGQGGVRRRKTTNLSVGQGQP